MNTYLKYQSPASHFLSFLMLAGGFFFVDFLISSFFFKDIYAILLNEKAVVSATLISRFKMAQVVTSIVSFIIPALLFGYFSSPRSLPYIGIQKSIVPVIILASVVLLFSIQPFVSWIGELNSKINFGEMQKSVLEKEALYNRAFKVFLEMHSVGDLLINLLIMALLPAIAEELFFRGAMQTVFMRLTKVPWLAIFITSVIFALLHGTYFKILPIFILGLIMGTVYYVTRNIWYSMIIHFLNNALAVLSVYYASSSSLIKKLSDDNLSVPVIYALISFLIAMATLYFIKNKSDEVFPEVADTDDNDIA